MLNSAVRFVAHMQQIIERSGELARRLSNSAVIWIWAVMVIRLSNFVLILPLVLRTLPSEMVGLWYVMLNLIGGVTLIELGMSAAISRHVSFALASATPDYSRIHSLIISSRRLYAFLATAVLLLSLAAGTWLTISHQATMFSAIPLISFGLMAGASSIRMLGLYWNPMLVGMNKVRQAQQVQFFGILASYVVTLAGLLLGAGVIALAIGQCVTLLYPMLRSRHLFRKQFPEVFQASAIDSEWRDIWFATWRTGLVMLGTWLGTHGLIVVSGQMLTLETSASFAVCFTIVFTIHSVSQSWLLARYPTISSMWATGKTNELRALVRTRLALSMATMLAGGSCVWLLLPTFLQWVGSQTVPLPPLTLAFLLVMTALDLYVGAHSGVLIACNRFPHLRPVLIAGVGTVCLAFVLVGKFEVDGIISAALVCILGVTLWLVPMQFRRVLREKPPLTAAIDC